MQHFKCAQRHNNVSHDADAEEDGYGLVYAEEGVGK
jgi:hypothetical protein